MIKLNFSNNSEDYYEVPVKYAGSRYSPIEHKMIIETIKENLNKVGVPIKSEWYKSNQDKTKLIGGYRIAYGDNNEFDFELSFRNSLDGSMSFAFVNGSKVLICENGMISGDFMYKRKHFGNRTEADIIEQLKYSMEYMEDTMNRNIKLSNELKYHIMNKSLSAELAGQLFIQEELLTGIQMNILKKEILEPSFDYGYPDTLWQFYNNVTVALKSSSPMNYHQKHKQLSDFIEKKIDFIYDEN